MYYHTNYSSPVGELTLCCHDNHLVGLWLEGQKYFGGSLSGEMVSGDSPVLSQAKSWLDHYFTGDRPDPKQLPLAPECSAFRQMVWQCLLDIPYGRTMTYGQLAQQVARGLNRPSMSARAVGNAAGHNPISIIIPCHRLVGSDHSLTGYAGGLERKRFLLRHENCSLALQQWA